MILVNRRGYPGTTPYSEADWDLIHRSQNEMDDGAMAMSQFMHDRGGDVHAFLVDFIRTANPPIKQNSIIVAGWSFTSAWIILLLAHASSYPGQGVDVPRYIRRAVTYGWTLEHDMLTAPSLTVHRSLRCDLLYSGDGLLANLI